jgi:phage protein U
MESGYEVQRVDLWRVQVRRSGLQRQNEYTTSVKRKGSQPLENRAAEAIPSAQSVRCKVNTYN